VEKLSQLNKYGLEIGKGRRNIEKMDIFEKGSKTRFLMGLASIVDAPMNIINLSLHDHAKDIINTKEYKYFTQYYTFNKSIAWIAETNNDSVQNVITSINNCEMAILKSMIKTYGKKDF
jgi:hypothetical protein